jgi:hypothetical protein
VTIIYFVIVGAIRIYKLQEHRLALGTPSRIYFFEIGACTVLAISALVELVGLYIIDRTVPGYKIAADLLVACGWVRSRLVI